MLPLQQPDGAAEIYLRRQMCRPCSLWMCAAISHATRSNLGLQPQAKHLLLMLATSSRAEPAGSGASQQPCRLVYERHHLPAEHVVCLLVRLVRWSWFARMLEISSPILVNGHGPGECRPWAPPQVFAWSMRYILSTIHIKERERKAAPARPLRTCANTSHAGLRGTRYRRMTLSGWCTSFPFEKLVWFAWHAGGRPLKNCGQEAQVLQHI